MRARLALVSLVLGLLAGVPSAAAAAPTNDDFADASVPPFPLLFDSVGDDLATVSGATKELGEPNHAGDPGGASVWFKWTAPWTGPVRAATCFKEFDTVMAVYAGSSVDNLTELTSSSHNTYPDPPLPSNPLGPDLDAAFGCSNEVWFEAAQGVTYRIAVDKRTVGVGPVANGRFFFGIGRPPDNDAFLAAQSLAGADSAVQGRTINATAQANEPSHAGLEPTSSVWYEWKAKASGETVVDTCGSDFDSVVGVYRGGSLGALSSVAANDDGCGNGQSRARFVASAGQTYRIAVDGPVDGLLDLSIDGADDPEGSLDKAKIKRRKRKAIFRFSSSTPDSSFECKLDGKRFKACDSPKKYRHLAPGRHEFQLAVTDPYGNADPTSESDRFRIPRRR